MCTGLELALIAGGTALSQGSQMHAMRKQDREAAAGIRRQGEIQQRAGQRVQKQIQELQASNPEAERKASMDSFMSALQKARAVPGGESFGTPGATSKRFAADVSSAREGADAEGAAAAGQLARIDAPILQRRREAEATGRTVSDLSMLERDSAAEDFLTKLRVSRIAPNPWLQALGQGASSFGMARAGRMLPESAAGLAGNPETLFRPGRQILTRQPTGLTTFFGGP